MWPALVRIMAVAGVATSLAGCGVADTHSNLPKFMRQAETPPPQQPAAPDVRSLVRDNLATIFVPSAHPTGIVISPPRRDARGAGWTACLKANVAGTSNQNIGTQTYVLFIENGRIWNRHRAGADDKCDAETYEPL